MDNRKADIMNQEKIKEYMNYYLNHFTSAKNKKWNYEDGCVLLGVIQIYKTLNEPYLKDFVIEYLDEYLTEEGTILYYDKEMYNIDCICTGRALFFAYEETGNEKYLIAIGKLKEQIESHPRTNSGNFWHKKIYPNQVWLDGLFMAQPFYMMWETKLGKKENYADIINQFKNVRDFLFDEEKKLYYHGYDETKSMPWADALTGRSANFWLRAMGWYVLALIDTMEEMSEQIFEYYKELSILFKEAISGLLPYMDKETNLFYQVIDKPSVKGNYLETSGSAMIAAAILKACRLKVLLAEKYQHIGEDILNSLVDTKLIKEGDKPVLKDICGMAGLGPGQDRDGSIEYYLSEPIVYDDHKGTGAFLMAYGQWLLLQD